MTYTYMLINIVALILPFACSFYGPANFSKKWRFVIPAILITAAAFIAWDMVFTRSGIWAFNPRYITGIMVGNLPLEEVLFFFCIPYACLFTYFALNNLIERDHLFPHHELISSVLIVVLLFAGTYAFDRTYTAVTFIATGSLLAFQMLKLRPRYMGRFYFAFGLLLIPFLLINGALTGWFFDEPVVWYNDRETLGIRVATIPVEDAVYALLLILTNVVIWEALESRFGK